MILTRCRIETTTEITYDDDINDEEVESNWSHGAKTNKSNYLVSARFMNLREMCKHLLIRCQFIFQDYRMAI